MFMYLFHILALNIFAVLKNFLEVAVDIKLRQNLIHNEIHPIVCLESAECKIPKKGYISLLFSISLFQMINWVESILPRYMVICN